MQQQQQQNLQHWNSCSIRVATVEGIRAQRIVRELVLANRTNAAAQNIEQLISIIVEYRIYIYFKIYINAIVQMKLQWIALRFVINNLAKKNEIKYLAG